MKIPYTSDYVKELWETSIDAPKRTTEAEAQEWIDDFNRDPFTKVPESITAEVLAEEWNTLCDWQDAESKELEEQKPWWM